jgi:hypothetical protein
MPEKSDKMPEKSEDLPRQDAREGVSQVLLVSIE